MLFAIALLFIPMFTTGMLLLWELPQLLAKNLQINEEQRVRKQVLLFTYGCLWVALCWHL